MDPGRSILLVMAVTAVAGGCRLERNPPRGTSNGEAPDGSVQLLGLRTVVYHVSDLGAAKEWYATLLGIEPYFDEAYYVGFSVGGYELGLDPDTTRAAPGAGGTVAYWGVPNADSTFARALALGATANEAVQAVGDGIRLGSVIDPFGNVLGLIENPEVRVVR